MWEASYNNAVSTGLAGAAKTSQERGTASGLEKGKEWGGSRGVGLQSESLRKWFPLIEP